MISGQMPAKTSKQARAPQQTSPTPAAQINWLRNAIGATVCLAAAGALTNSSTVLADVPAPIQKVARAIGIGWGDGYHACKDGGCRPGADLPPSSFSDRRSAKPVDTSCQQVYPAGTLAPIRRQTDCQSGACDQISLGQSVMRPSPPAQTLMPNAIPQTPVYQPVPAAQPSLAPQRAPENHGRQPAGEPAPQRYRSQRPAIPTPPSSTADESDDSQVPIHDDDADLLLPHKEQQAADSLKTETNRTETTPRQPIRMNRLEQEERESSSPSDLVLPPSERKSPNLQAPQNSATQNSATQNSATQNTVPPTAEQRVEELPKPDLREDAPEPDYLNDKRFEVIPAPPAEKGEDDSEDLLDSDDDDDDLLSLNSAHPPLGRYQTQMVPLAPPSNQPARIRSNPFVDGQPAGTRVNQPRINELVVPRIATRPGHRARNWVPVRQPE